MNIKKQMIYLTVLPRASNAGLQSPIWTRLRCYVIFLSVESTLADEKWRKCWFSIPYSFTDLKEGFTRRKYIKKYLNGRLDRKYCILWDCQIPNSKKGDQSLENGKTGKIRMPSEWYICYLVNDSDPFYRTRVQSLAMLVTHWLSNSLTHWLTDSRLVNLMALNDTNCLI